MIWAAEKLKKPLLIDPAIVVRPPVVFVAFSAKPTGATPLASVI